MKRQKNVSDIIDSLQKHIKAEIKDLDTENEILLNQSRKHFREVLSKSEGHAPQKEGLAARASRKSYAAINKLKTFISSFSDPNTTRRKFFDSLKKRAGTVAGFFSFVFKRKKFK